jgi:UDP-N-acetylmuramoyl-tripeptide--D-alanyl-D-alanine ligase
MNALAAAAAAHAAGAGLDDIEQGLRSVQAVSGRMQLKPALAGARLIDDSYNANPGSVRAGLISLATIPGEHWLVLGEMAELGPQSARLHAEIGELARETGVARLLAVGPETRHAVESFGPGASWFANADELVAAAAPELQEGVTVLIKGSRVNRLERVAAALTAQGTINDGGAH